MMRSIVKTLLYMDPVEFSDGHGFRTIVEMRDGRYALISEVHRRTSLRELDETMVFECDKSGQVKNWSALYEGPEEVTAGVISRAAEWYS